MVHLDNEEDCDMKGKGKGKTNQHAGDGKGKGKLRDVRGFYPYRFQLKVVKDKTESKTAWQESKPWKKVWNEAQWASWTNNSNLGRF